MKTSASFLAVLLWPVLLFGQAVPASGNPVDPQRVDRAIESGIRLLREKPVPKWWRGDHSAVLVLWTFVHAGVPKTDPRFQELLKKVTQTKLERTYQASLQAMILEELDRVRFQDRISQCAQFLIDNQCKNGQWSYGEPTPAVGETAPSEKEVATGEPVRKPSSENGGKPPILRKLTLKKTRDGPATGDNSNSQYAALGLRASHDSGIVIPPSVIALAVKAWREGQRGDPEVKKEVQTARGWVYSRADYPPKDDAYAPYASMTAGGVGSLAIYDYLQGKDWRKDPQVQAGVRWLAAHYSVVENPGVVQYPGYKRTMFQGYWFYALERVGRLYGTDRLGPHVWYAEGAKALLDAQKPDGSWDMSPRLGEDPNEFVWDTCFAILFLKRATRPLEAVPSEDRYVKPPSEGGK